jgi:hypothetical protein
MEIAPHDTRRLHEVAEEAAHCTRCPLYCDAMIFASRWNL